MAVGLTAKLPVTVPDVDIWHVGAGVAAICVNVIVQGRAEPVAKPPPVTAISPSRVPNPGGASGASGDREIVGAPTFVNDPVAAGPWSGVTEGM
jgi:hypothetical protein